MFILCKKVRFKPLKFLMFNFPRLAKFGCDRNRPTYSGYYFVTMGHIVFLQENISSKVQVRARKEAPSRERVGRPRLKMDNSLLCVPAFIGIKGQFWRILPKHHSWLMIGSWIVSDSYVPTGHVSLPKCLSETLGGIRFIVKIRLK